MAPLRILQEARHDPDEIQEIERVAAREPPGLLKQSEQPLELESLPRARCAPIRPGDRLTGVVTLAEMEEKQGRIGHMVFFHFDVVWTNQEGIEVMKLRQSFIKY